MFFVAFRGELQDSTYPDSLQVHPLGHTADPNIIQTSSVLAIWLSTRYIVLVISNAVGKVNMT